MKKLILAAALLCGAFPASAGETGCFYDMKGGVEIKKPAREWEPAMKGRPVGEGDAIRTGAAAWCEILFKDGSFIKMDGNSETAAEELKVSAEERVFSFSFLKGKALWMAGKVSSRIKSRFAVRTPTAVCAVRGTDFAIDISSAGDTTVGLFEGHLAVSGAGLEKEMNGGNEASAGAAGLAVKGRLSRLMAAEERRYARLKGRVESLRKRLSERDSFIDDYAARQLKKISDFNARREEKLRGKK